MAAAGAGGDSMTDERWVDVGRQLRVVGMVATALCFLRGHNGAVHLCQPPSGDPSMVICERCERVLWYSPRRVLMVGCSSCDWRGPHGTWTRHMALHHADPPL